MTTKIIDLSFMLAILGIILLFSYFTDPHQWMLYRTAINSHQDFFTFITANFTHFNMHHLAENIFAYVLIWFLFFGENSASYPTKLIALGISALTTTLGVYFFSNVSIYSGLSGALHGMVICACVLRLILDKDFKGAIVIAIVTAKIYIDFFYPEFGFNELSQKLYGDSMRIQQFISSGSNKFEVCAPSHLYGALGGLISAIIILAKSKIGRKIIK
jgi:membrane associated rhomboid family serine protease